MKSYKKVATQGNNQFSEVVSADIQRSSFLRNSSLKTSFDAGKLVPVYLDEVLPGDTFEMDIASLSRLATPVFPTMDDLYLDFYAFFVPNRLVWTGWEQLMGENKTSAWVPNSPPALVPVVSSANFNPPYVSQISGALGDYFGIPIGFNFAPLGSDDFVPVSLLPFRAYGLIWNEWFRDENLQAPIPLNLDSSGLYVSILVDFGRNPGPNTKLAPVNKFHDYFTSALPSPQKGESQLIPIELNELIPVITGERQNFGGVTRVPLEMRSLIGGDSNVGNSFMVMQGSVNDYVSAAYLNIEDPFNSLSDVTPSNLWADGRGMQINATTIAELRTAFQIQKLFERDARGGTRYVEMLKSHFGVDAQDYRLQRPEFLGSRRTVVGVQQVPQTSASASGSTPQGNLAAYSYTTDTGKLFSKSFVEHGMVMIFAVARQKKSYQQGLPKMFTRRERLDYYFPTLAHISEQPIRNFEIQATLDSSVPANKEYMNGVFGYQEAWAEYRYKPNQITGKMRSDVNGSLDMWHYADWYGTDKVYLSDDWIKDNSNTNVARTVAATNTDGMLLICDIAFKNKTTRPMPVRSIPGLVDHF